MGWCTMKQENGEFAVWCTVSDEFLLVNGNAEDVMSLYVEAAEERARREAQHAMDRANGVAAPKPRYTVQACINTVKARNPNDELLVALEGGVSNDRVS